MAGKFRRSVKKSFNIRSKYQEGGYINPYDEQDNNDATGEYYNNTPQSDQVVFDSTQGFSTNEFQPDIDDYGDFYDELPMDDEGGYDLSKFEPTFFNRSLVHKVERNTQAALDYLETMGIKPSSTMGGRHNVGSKHYHGKAFDLGLNTSFGGDINKMQEFENNFINLQRTNPLFARFKIIDETVRPKGQKVWNGAHLHIEFLD